MKKYIFTILAVAAVFSSCKDFLVEEPNLAQSTELTLSTFEGLDNATAGAYAPLASTNWYGAHFILDSEMQSGNGKRWIEFSQYNSGRYTDQYSVHYTPNSTSPLWGQAYFVILSANAVLEHLNDAGIEATEQEKNNLKAECLFLRALAHFDLVRVYAQGYGFTSDASHPGVPYVTKVDSEAKPARETVAKVFENIIQDLLDAEAAMDPDYSRGGGKDPRGYANLQAIQALLARVYLYKKDYANAAAYATKVIEAKDENGTPKYSLWKAADFKDAKNYTTDVPTGGEIIFEIYNNTSSSYGTGLENCWGMTSYKQYGDCGASKDLLDLYEDNDVRKSLLSPDPDGNALFTLKYNGKGLAAVDANNVIILRLAEMYLIRAEANVAGNLNLGQATADLKALADSRGATPATASVDYILVERRKELAWEGHYWYDLARLGKPMTREDISGNVPTQIPAGDYRWALPIPDREFTVNPNLKQNEGYNEN